MVPPLWASAAQTVSENAHRRLESNALLWSTAPLHSEPKKTVSQLDFVNAAGAQFGFLSELRGWRETLRGTGSAPSREVWAAKNQIGTARFSVGKIAAPPSSGLAFIDDNGAGMRAQLESARWGTLEFGTNFRPKALVEVLSHLDDALAGEKIEGAPQNLAHYLRTKPKLAQNLDTEFSVLRATRGSDGRSGLFFEGKANLKLPANWSATGQFARAGLDDSQARGRWSLKAQGELTHFLGAARAEIEHREIEAGFATFSSRNLFGEEWSQARLTQPIKRGELSGQIQIVANERERADAQYAHWGEEIKRRTAQTNADLAFQISPEMSVRATGKLAGEQSRKSLGENRFLLDKTVGGVADLGLEWRPSKALRIGASTGFTRSQESRFAAISDVPISGIPISGVQKWQPMKWQPMKWQVTQENEENRLALELQHQSGENELSLKYALHERRSNFAAAQADWMAIETVRFEAGRKFSDDFKIRTLFDIARERETPWSQSNALARRAEAQISLLQSARIDWFPFWKPLGF